MDMNISLDNSFIRKLIRQGDLESENVATLLENILEGNVLSAQDVECFVVDCEESVEHSLLLLVCLLPEHPSLRVLAVSLIHSHNTDVECFVVDCEESVEHSLLLLVCLLPEHPSLRVLAVSLIHSHNTSIEGDLTPRALALNRGLLASVVGPPQ
uniref:Uncharacterized protein n=1 Tax=Timema poppense TaxID=170557 RepID=A0A7R9DG00_TIMPO|nr:unnamed protein product [Timema poppensis]